jgi:DNA-binding NtrC family response regulator
VVIIAVSYDSQSLNRRMAALQQVGHIIVPASSLASALHAIETGHYHLLLIGATVSTSDQQELAKASRTLHPYSKIISVAFPESEPIKTADRQVPAGDENAVLVAVTALVSGDAESDIEMGRR